MNWSVCQKTSWC